MPIRKWSPGGDVVSVNGIMERRDEIRKWEGHHWFRTLWLLNLDLTLLDPNYTLIQVKEKFGQLRFYFRTERRGSIRNLMNTRVHAAELSIVELEKNRSKCNSNNF